MTPLISVMMPCYNATSTLPLALASLSAQTYSNWECIIVDDGSTDRPDETIQIVNDDRIRLFRFEKNRGRGAARQEALDQANGEYLCMLDADDWMYPQKLEQQCQIMESTPDIALLSTSMAIVNARNEIVGTRSGGSKLNGLTLFPALDEPKDLSIAHAPSMMRASIAKQIEYDTSLRLTEDVDFLLSILLHHPYGVLPDATYVYSEIVSINLSKITQSLRYGRRMFLKYRHDYPRAAYTNYLVKLLKEGVYRVGFSVGLGEQLIARRSQKPSEEASRDFFAARRIVYQKVTALFSGTQFGGSFSPQSDPEALGGMNAN